MSIILNTINRAILFFFLRANTRHICEQGHLRRTRVVLLREMFLLRPLHGRSYATAFSLFLARRASKRANVVQIYREDVTEAADRQKVMYVAFLFFFCLFSVGNVISESRV